MKNLLKNDSGAVSYLLLVGFLLSIFVVTIIYMLESDIVGFFDVNFYSGTTLDITDSRIQYTHDTLLGIFKYILVIAIIFIGLKALSESMINQR